MATVFVFKPGNLSDSKQLKRMNEFVAEMETINSPAFGSWGPIGTLYFPREFIAYETSIQEGRGLTRPVLRLSLTESFKPIPSPHQSLWKRA